MGRLADLDKRLDMIKDMKRYAVEDLGVPENRSFTRLIDTKHIYVLYASRKDRIEAILPGFRSNDSFFSETECIKAAEQLENEGYDVEYVLNEAYGHESCPVTQSLLESSLVRLSYVVFHENFHVYCQMQSVLLDPAVEEAAADVFGHQASLGYFGLVNKKLIPKINQELDEWMEIADFVNKYLDLLSQAYESGFEKGRAMLQQARDEALSRNLGLPVEDMNNAFFLRQGFYYPFFRVAHETLADVAPQEYLADPRILYDLEKMCLSESFLDFKS